GRLPIVLHRIMSMRRMPEQFDFASLRVHSSRKFEALVHRVQRIRKISLGSQNNAQALSSSNLNVHEPRSVCALHTLLKEPERIVITTLLLLDLRQIQ